jgi:ribonuclease VapC
MMVADTSAIMAVLMLEPERPAFNRLMVNDGEVLISTATTVELMIVAMGKGEDIYQSAIQFLERPFIQLIPFDEEQFRMAADAYLRYGKGRGHPARLNFGDTFAYALASTRGLPLLFKGDDFARTDIAAAV